MTTITLLPHQEKALEAALNAGVIVSVAEFLDAAISHLPQSAQPIRTAEPANLVELFEPVRGLLTDEEIDTLFSRDRSPSRPIDLS